MPFVTNAIYYVKPTTFLSVLVLQAKYFVTFKKKKEREND